MNNENFEQLTAKEVAPRYFRTSEAVVYQWMRQGIFPRNVAFRIGRKVLFNKLELETWLQNGGTIQNQSDTARAA